MEQESFALQEVPHAIWGALQHLLLLHRLTGAMQPTEDLCPSGVAGGPRGGLLTVPETTQDVYGGVYVVMVAQGLGI